MRIRRTAICNSRTLLLDEFKLNFNSDPGHAAKMNSESCAFVPSQVRSGPVRSGPVRSGHVLFSLWDIRKRDDELTISVDIQKVKTILVEKWRAADSTSSLESRFSSICFCTRTARISECTLLKKMQELRASKDVSAWESVLWILIQQGKWILSPDERPKWPKN